MPMNLSNEDRNWLDSKFGEVHTRITRSDTANTKALNEQTQMLTVKIGNVQTSLQVHEATPCLDVKTHEMNHHDSKKYWAMLAAIIAVASGIGAFVMWLIKVGTVRP